MLTNDDNSSNPPVASASSDTQLKENESTEDPIISDPSDFSTQDSGSIVWAKKDLLWWPAVLCGQSECMGKVKVQYLGTAPLQVWLENKDVEPYVGSLLDKDQHCVVDGNYQEWANACVIAERTLPLSLESRCTLIANKSVGLKQVRKRLSKNDNHNGTDKRCRDPNASTSMSNRNNNNGVEEVDISGDLTSQNEKPDFLKVNLEPGCSGYVCQRGKCMKMCRTKKEILSHLNLTHECFYCTECYQLFNNIEDLTIHTLDHKI